MKNLTNVFLEDKETILLYKSKVVWQTALQQILEKIATSSNTTFGTSEAFNAMFVLDGVRCLRRIDTIEYPICNEEILPTIVVDVYNKCVKVYDATEKSLYRIKRKDEIIYAQYFSTDDKPVDTDTIVGLKNALHSGIVKFSYKKVDGSTRIARGTLNKSVCEELKSYYDNRGDKEERQVPDNILRYWDVEKNGWRSTKFENILDIFNEI
jgi:hypothetical protein